MILISKKNLGRLTSKIHRVFFWNNSLALFVSSVFDSLPIPYPKRDYINEDDSSTVIKPEPVMTIKSEASSVLLNQQQHNLAQSGHSQQVISASMIFRSLYLSLQMKLIQQQSMSGQPPEKKLRVNGSFTNGNGPSNHNYQVNHPFHLHSILIFFFIFQRNPYQQPY